MIKHDDFTVSFNIGLNELWDTAEGCMSLRDHK